MIEIQPTVRQLILELLYDIGEMRPVDLRAQIGCNRRAVERSLARLLRDGRVERRAAEFGHHTFYYLPARAYGVGQEWPE